MSKLPVRKRRRQSGVALLAMLFLLTLWGLSLFVGSLNATQFQTARTQNAASAMAEAKEALIGDAVAQVLLKDAGYLRLPDLGEKPGPVPAEGEASLNFAGNNKDFSVIGKFPWQTLRTPALRDAQGECLWYVVSGRFKKFPLTDVLNWDTQGQIDLIDGSGSLIATNLAAMVVAPGQALDGQSRVQADAAYKECGGNYEVSNYLDSIQIDNAVAGQVNYFTGSTNSRVATGTGNKRFVLADSRPYNDRFLYVTVDEIFDRLLRRGDFAAAIGNLLDNPTFRSHLQGIAVAGNKGTDHIDCSVAPDPDFCNNWKEMLFLTQLPGPSSITIDGIPANNCQRVLIFAGRRTSGQLRSDATTKANKNNYLENANATSFSVPVATTSNFNGALAFSAASPSSDLLRCLP